ncbi:START-like protein [Gracilaria domingensis]|nr:START-like protein [Gracilaria domingensis]
MSDWTNLAKWDVNITKSELAASEPADARGEGTKYDCAFSLQGSDIEVDYTCVKYEEPDLCQFVGLAKLFRSQDTLEFESKDDGTKITAEFNLTFRGLLSPFSFVMNGAMQKTGPIVMDDIKKFVTAQLED